ncbi:porin family protein [bacterium]|nr:porin family protein [bacterium]
MKKVLVPVLVMMVTCFCAGSALALPGLSMEVGVNVPMPSGDFGDVFKTGIGGSANAFVGLPMMPLKFGGHVGYNRFPYKNIDDENFSIIEVVPSARYQMGLPLVGYAFVQAGVGLFRLSSSISGVDSENKLGFNVGAGAALTLLPSLNIFAMPSYTWIDNEDTSTTYITLTVGLSF